LACHIIGCLWIVAASMSDEEFEYKGTKYKSNWITHN